VTWELSLPWPPSVNHYWRHDRGITHISAEGRAYRVAVWGIVKRSASSPKDDPSWPLDGRVRIVVHTHAPDNRARDLDNILKALLDALGHAKVYLSDAQIDDLHVIRGISQKPRGSVYLTIEEIRG